MNLGYTRPSPQLQVPPCVLPVSNEHYTLPTHPLLTSKSMRAGLEMKHKKRFLYKYLSKHAAEIISWTEEESTMQGHVSNTRREGTGVISGISKEWPTAC